MMKSSGKIFSKPLNKVKVNNLYNLSNNKLNKPKHNTKEIEGHLNIINDLYLKKKYKQVIDELNPFLKKYPKNIDGKNLLALSYKQIGDFNKAINLFQSLIAEYPQEGFFSTNLANIFYNQGKISLAIEQYKRCIEIGPLQINAYTGLGNCYTELGRFNEAIDILKKALISDPKNESVNYNLGNIYRKLGKYKEAIPYYSNTNILLSKSHQLECYYLSNDKENFLTNLKKHEENKVLNPLAACLSSHSSILYSQNNTYSFCKNPFDYIFSKNLIENNIIKKSFIEEVKIALKELKLDYRDQELLKKGNQSSGNIFMTENKTINKLKAIILKEIESYRKSFNKSSDDYIKSWPEKFQLYGWVVNISKGGSLSSHIHKEGWMSGSLYFEIPKKIEKNDGNIVFSMTGANYPSNGFDFKEQVVETIKGGIVLFPSSLFHNTIPFKSNEERMTIAFDIIPIN